MHRIDARVPPVRDWLWIRPLESEDFAAVAAGSGSLTLEPRFSGLALGLWAAGSGSALRLRERERARPVSIVLKSVIIS